MWRGYKTVMDYAQYVVDKDMQVTDSGMDKIVNVIRERYSGIAVEGSYHVQIIHSRANKDKLKDYISNHFDKNPHLSSVRKLIVPVNIHNKHWICVVAMIWEHIICIYDSAVTCGDLIESDVLKAVTTVEYYLAMYGRIHQVPHFYDVPWKTYHCMFTTQQNDSWSCGLHVAKCMLLNAMQPEALLDNVELASTEGMIANDVNCDNIDKVINDVDDMSEEQGSCMSSWIFPEDMRDVQPMKLRLGERLVWITEPPGVQKFIYLEETSQIDWISTNACEPRVGTSIQKFIKCPKWPKGLTPFEESVNLMMSRMNDKDTFAFCFFNTPSFAMECLILRALSNRQSSSKVFIVSDKINVDNIEDCWMTDIGTTMNSSTTCRQSVYRSMLYDSIKHCNTRHIKIYWYNDRESLMSDWKNGVADFSVYFTDIEDVEYRRQMFDRTYIDIVVLSFYKNYERMKVTTYYNKRDSITLHFGNFLYSHQLEEYPTRSCDGEMAQITNYYIVDGNVHVVSY